VKSELSLAVLDGAASTPERLVMVANAQRVAHGRPVATVTCSCGSDVLWSTCSHAHVTAVAGTPSFVALAAQDASLQLLSMAGRRLLPPLALASPVALIGASKDMLVAVLSNGDVRAWNVAQGKVRS
jgi:hypothetical protein